MRMIELLRKLPIYDDLLKQVPEADRPAAVAALEEQLLPYENLIASVPEDALGKFMKSLDNNDTVAGNSTSSPSRREPRRF